MKCESKDCTDEGGFILQTEDGTTSPTVCAAHLGEVVQTIIDEYGDGAPVFLYPADRR